jgi:hypothetical protein
LETFTSTGKIGSIVKNLTSETGFFSRKDLTGRQKGEELGREFKFCRRGQRERLGY